MLEVGILYLSKTPVTRLLYFARVAETAQHV